MKIRQNFRCHFIKIAATDGNLTGKIWGKYKLDYSQQKTTFTRDFWCDLLNHLAKEIFETKDNKQEKM